MICNYQLYPPTGVSDDIDIGEEIGLKINVPNDVADPRISLSLLRLAIATLKRGQSVMFVSNSSEVNRTLSQQVKQAAVLDGIPQVRP